VCSCLTLFLYLSVCAYLSVFFSLTHSSLSLFPSLASPALFLSNGFQIVDYSEPRFFGILIFKVVELWELCLALNAMTQKCQPFRYEYYENVEETEMAAHPDWRDGKDVHHPLPELYTNFLEAFEVTAEVFLSPIDVRTKLLSASQIQTLYNTNKHRMDSIIGELHAPLIC